MPWQQLTLHTHQSHAENLSSDLFELGALSVTYLDRGDQPLYEPGPGEMPLWEAVTLLVLFEHEADLTVVTDYCRTQAHAITEFAIAPLADQAWERAWMADFKPMRFGDRLWVIPSGYDVPDDTAVNVFLDPGLAFGTGTHATTAMCLERLSELSLTGQRVLDYGCGSGILAIAALKLGAKEAIAVDNDPQALLATKDNADKNGVQMAAIVLPDALVPAVFDVVVANILAAPLIALAPELSRRCAGRLILSGLLVEQVDAVIAAYPEVAFASPRVKDGWICLCGEKIPSQNRAFC